MKKLFTLSAMLFMLVALFTTSCSTEKSVVKAFVKNGYEMGTLTPVQQSAVAPMLSVFPAYSIDALGYLASGNTITFVYNQDDAAWNAYGSALLSNGYSSVAGGYVKADKSAGVTYNVSSTITVIYKTPCRLVTFAVAEF